MGGDPVQGAIIGGVSAGAAKYAGQKFSFLDAGAGTDDPLKFAAAFLGRAVIGAVVGGAASEATGGEFSDGARLGAISASVAFVANDFFHRVNGKIVARYETDEENTIIDYDVEDFSTDTWERGESRKVSSLTTALGDLVSGLTAGMSAVSGVKATYETDVYEIWAKFNTIHETDLDSSQRRLITKTKIHGTEYRVYSYTERTEGWAIGGVPPINAR